MTEIASHRGGAALWPENSETAFRETAKLDVEQIEFDVQISADGVPVIFHDATLDRVTNGTGPLAARSVAQLKALDIFDNGGKIMTLQEGIDILAPSHLVLRCEIKPGVDMVPYPQAVDKTLEVFDQAGLLERTVITSFHLPTLIEVRSRAFPPRDIIWLVADPLVRLTSAKHIARIAQYEGIPSVALRHTELRGDALEELRAAGLNVGAFAVLEDEAIRWALDSQIEVFTTDRPDAALKIREDFES